MSGQDDAATLEASYANARYAVRLPAGVLDLRVGVPAPGLEALGTRCAGFITAWNPSSVPVPPERNAAADGAMCSRLDAAGLSRLPAWADDARGQWHEEGWLVLGIDLDSLRALAIEFAQAGVLFWRSGGPVQLVMTPAPTADGRAGGG